MALPGEEDVRGYFRALSNWGRWGDDGDLFGALNFVTPQKRVQAAALVRSGRTVGCSRLMTRTTTLGKPAAFLHLMMETGEGWASPGKPTSGRREMAKDFVAMDVHGLNTTHIDSLGHFFEDGRMYGGASSALVSANHGATRGAVENLRDGVVTRGVLLDIAALRGKPSLDPAEPIHPHDLEAAERAAGVTVEAGDALLIRTGFPEALRGGMDPARSGAPGVHASCLPWLHERSIAILASDCWTDVDPSGYAIDFPVHRIAEVAMGVRCIDNGDFDALADACAQEGRREFMLCLAPLRLEAATGCPLNPIAVF